MLATKLYGTMTDRPNESRLSALNIRRALDASLKRLQTDYIDLYQFHHVDRKTPWDEIWQAIDVAVQQGKILYSGSSNFAGWHIAQAQEAAARRHSIGLVSEQSIYNLLTRNVELEVIPAAQQYGLGLIPWSPLQGGLLGGVLKKGRDGVRRAEGRALETLEKHREQIRRYEDFADELGREPGGRRAGLAAAPARRDRADRGPPHPGAARRGPPRPGPGARRRRAQAAGRASSRGTGPRRRITRGDGIRADGIRDGSGRPRPGGPREAAPRDIYLPGVALLC